MKLSGILSIAAVATTMGVTAAAHATVFTVDVTLSATPGLDTVIAPPNSGISLDDRTWNIAGAFAPFNLAAGDEIDVNATFTSPVAITAGLLPIEIANVSFADGLGSSGFTTSTTTTVTFGGTSGAFSGNPPTTNQTVTVMGEAIAAGTTSVSLTPSSMSFTDLSFVIDIDAVPPQNAPLQFSSIQILDDFNPVPAPGALALFGLGLAGLGALRRRKAA